MLPVHVSSKLFPESDKVVLTLACGLAVLCPGLALAKISAVPDMLLLLFIWLDIAIITKLDKNPSTRMLLEFVLVLGLGIMFHAAMILPAIAGGIYLYHLEKKEKISGRQLVFLGTVLIIIVASIQGVESFWLNSIMKGTEYQSKTALGSFIYGMVVNWDIEGFTKFLQSLIGKIFNFGTGTLLFGLLGVLFFDNVGSLKSIGFL